MKWLDRVRVTSDKYEKEGVKKGAEGVIIFAWLMHDQYEVVFCDKKGKDYAEILIHVSDLELVREIDGITDEDILKDLPNPNYWCKVEDGYILNLKGERKNKIPYDYNS